MTDVVSEVQEDGSTTISGTAHKSNYDMELNRLDGILPEIPPMDALSKLFKPRYVLKVTTPDGIEIPFVYKRIDPATMILTQGSPLGISLNEVAGESNDIAEKLQSLREGLDAASSDADADAKLDEMRDLMSDEKTQGILQTAQTLRQRVIQSGVLSPEITDDLYENLDDDILNALYEAITGGVTSSNELVEHFRKGSEESAVS